MRNRKLKFKRSVPDDIRSILEKQYSEYLENNKLSKKETTLLYEWICSGRSPYDNEYDLCTDNGIPKDFIIAQRLTNNPDCDVSIEYDTEQDAAIYQMRKSTFQVLNCRFKECIR